MRQQAQFASEQRRTSYILRERMAAYPEVAFTMLILAITLALSSTLNLPFNLPAGDRAAFVGMHYLYPIVGLCVWAALAAVGQKRQLLRTFLVALPCYAIVLVCHFNIKLWIPHINPALWDNLYWSIDQLVRPLIDVSIAIRDFIGPVIPLDSNFYLSAFVVMFYVSFSFHAVATPDKFRTLFLAALFLQGLGSLAYLAMPAIGPFLFEAGVELRPTMAQASMFEAWQANVAGGPAWLRENGGTHITVGLAAMPSLHAGASFLFLLFAWKYGRVLLIPYVLLFSYIMIAAIANRWHYVIDLPVGIALAWLSSWAAHAVSRYGSSCPAQTRAHAGPEAAIPKLPGCATSAIGASR